MAVFWPEALQMFCIPIQRSSLQMKAPELMVTEQVTAEAAETVIALSVAVKKEQQ